MHAIASSRGLMGLMGREERNNVSETRGKEMCVCV